MLGFLLGFLREIEVEKEPNCLDGGESNLGLVAAHLLVLVAAAAAAMASYFWCGFPWLFWVCPNLVLLCS